MVIYIKCMGDVDMNFFESSVKLKIYVNNIYMYTSDSCNQCRNFFSMKLNEVSVFVPFDHVNCHISGVILLLFITCLCSPGRGRRGRVSVAWSRHKIR